MVQFIPVDPADIPTERLGRRGRVSYPLLKGFLEANTYMAKMDLTGLDKNPAYLRSVLYSYIKSHKLPIKIFQAGGDMYLMRLDMDKTGTINPSWKPESVGEEQTTEGASGYRRNEVATPINAAEVAARFGLEQNLTTK